MDGVILSAIIGAAIGSFATNIVTKWQEGKQKEAEFNRDISKTFFLAKLKTAQEIYAQLSLSLVALNNVRILFKSIEDPEKAMKLDNSVETSNKNLIKSMEDNVKKVNSMTSVSSNSFGLFFKSNDISNFGEIAEELNQSIVLVGQKHKSFLDAEGKYTNTILPHNFKTGLAEEYDKSITDYKAAIAQSIKNFSNFESIVKKRLNGLTEYYQKFDTL